MDRLTQARLRTAMTDPRAFPSHLQGATFDYAYKLVRVYRLVRVCGGGGLNGFASATAKRSSVRITIVTACFSCYRGQLGKEHPLRSGHPRRRASRRLRNGPRIGSPSEHPRLRVPGAPAFSPSPAHKCLRRTSVKALPTGKQRNVAKTTGKVAPKRR